METVKSGDKRLISYAVDLGTRITDKFGTKQALISEVHASRGVLTIKMAAEETRTYTVRNVDQKAKTLILEHPLRQGYTLLNQKPSEKTANAYRFEVQLAPGATREFPVSEERVFDMIYSATNLTPDTLVEYARNTSLSDAARTQLQRIATEKSQIAEADRNLRDIDSQTTALTADEDRYRKNISSLNSVAAQQQLVQDYARQLSAASQQITAMRDRRAAEQKRKSGLESELGRLIEGLSF